MDAVGALRARIRLESPARSADNIGGAALSWADEGEVWAAIETAGAGLADDRGAAVSTNNFRVTIKSRADVRAGWRAAWGARVLRIVGVRDDGGARLVLECEEERA